MINPAQPPRVFVDRSASLRPSARGAAGRALPRPSLPSNGRAFADNFEGVLRARKWRQNTSWGGSLRFPTPKMGDKMQSRQNHKNENQTNSFH